MSTKLDMGLAHIAGCRNDIGKAMRSAEKMLEKIRKHIVGKVVWCDRLGRQKGNYQISDVQIDHDGRLIVHGLKITATGRTGSQAWDLGMVDLHRLSRMKG